jgi:hypothetical protein
MPYQLMAGDPGNAFDSKGKAGMFKGGQVTQGDEPADKSIDSL